MTGWTWEDAYRPDLTTRDGANRALRLELAASKHYPAEAWLPGAFTLAAAFEEYGWPWQARALRGHAARIAKTRPLYAGRCAR